MKSLQRILDRFPGIFVISLFAVHSVFAAEGAGADPAETPVGSIFRWLNFAIIFGGIAFLIAKHGGSFFRNNAKSIAASIHEATAVKEEAERELRQVEQKMARLEPDVAEMRQEAQRNWAAESERLYASGQAEIEKIAQAARAELGASERAAQQQLQAVAATLAVQRAAELVSSRMNSEVRARMFQSFLRELGRGSH